MGRCLACPGFVRYQMGVPKECNLSSSTRRTGAAAPLESNGSKVPFQADRQRRSRAPVLAQIFAGRVPHSYAAATDARFMALALLRSAMEPALPICALAQLESSNEDWCGLLRVVLTESQSTSNLELLQDRQTP